MSAKDIDLGQVIVRLHELDLEANRIRLRLQAAEQNNPKNNQDTKQFTGRIDTLLGQKEIFIERIEVYLREELGKKKKKINNRVVCDTLQIKLRTFAHPREVFIEILAAMRRLEMTNAEIRQRLQQYCPLIQAYRQAFKQTIQSLNNTEATP